MTERMNFEQAAAAYARKAEIEAWITHTPSPEKSGPVDSLWFSLRTENNDLICLVSCDGCQVKTPSGALPEYCRTTRW